MTQTNVTLTAQQEQAKDRLLDFINTQDHAIILQGHAGTGKTTIIKEVQRQRQAYEELLNLSEDTIPAYTWHYTATTHKAREALQIAINARVKTLHSFLGLIPSKAGYTQANEMITGLGYSILVIDECSYIDYPLLDCLNRFLQSNPKARIIFMGDKNQLPPVGLNHCPVYYSSLNEVTLTQSVRQKDSPLIDEAASMFRQMVLGSPLTPITTDDKQVVLLAKRQWDQQMITSFDEGRDTKVIRHSNHQVTQSNDKLFKYFNGRRQLQAGDKVICNSYYRGIYSDTLMTVHEVREANCYGIPSLMITAAIAGSHTQSTFAVAKDTSQLRKHLSQVYARDFMEHTKVSKAFADIRPTYACTAHKSQGSTYDEVFINLTDFKRVYQSDPKMVARLLYVAFSRARHTVYLTGDIV